MFSGCVCVCVSWCDTLYRTILVLVRRDHTVLDAMLSAWDCVSYSIEPAYRARSACHCQQTGLVESPLCDERARSELGETREKVRSCVSYELKVDSCRSTNLVFRGFGLGLGVMGCISTAAYHQPYIESWVLGAAYQQLHVKS